MYAVVKFIATILSLVFFIDRAGRRKLLLTSSVGTSLALWYIGAFVTARHVDLTRPQEKSVAGWVAIVCVYIYAVRVFPSFPFPFLVLTTSKGILLLRLERRRLGLLRRDLPHAHQGARRLPHHRLPMALPIRRRPCVALHAVFPQRRLLLLFRGLYHGYGGVGVVAGA